MPELERALRGLGSELVYPPTPELAGAVGRRLRAAPAARRRRRALALAFASLAAALAAALAVPQARSALLELLGIRGAAVERVETLPDVGPAGRLVPGDRVSFEEAQAAVGFPVVRPRTKGGGPCGALYLERSVPRGMVSVVCPVDGARRLVLTQFRGAHTPYVEKAAGPGTAVSHVRVGEARGIWLEGAPHVVSFRDTTGEIRDVTRRVAGDVLLWERDGVTYRLEGALGREHALRTAADLG